MDAVQARFFQKIVTGVLATVVNSHGQVLFVAQERGPFAGHWLLPGGGIEPGESSAAAVVREVQEETGIRIQAPEYVALYEMRGEWSGAGYHLMMLGFRAIADGEIPPRFRGHHVGGVQWAVPAAMPLHSTDMQILNDAGLTHFPDEEIQKALARDGILLTAFPGSPR